MRFFRADFLGPAGSRRAHSASLRGAIICRIAQSVFRRMSSFHQFLYRICLRSAWPMVMVMLFWTLVVLGPLLGRGLLYMLPLLVAGLGAFFALRALLGEALNSARALPETGELPYGFAGHSIHAFSDPEGQVWLRARDVRRVLGLQRTDAWMAQAYPDGYRRAHPGSAAWFVRPGTVHRHWGGSTWPEVNRFLHFLERELVPLQTRRAASASVPGQPAAGGAPDAAGSKGQGVPGYLARQWRGEQGLLHLALWGAVLAALVSHVLLFDPEPAELTAHYRRYALILLAELLGGTLLSAWWGVGAWRAARRWFGADRSLLAGLVVAMAGMTMLLYAFDHLADRDRQMGLICAGGVGRRPGSQARGRRVRRWPAHRAFGGDGVRHDQPGPRPPGQAPGHTRDRARQPGRQRQRRLRAGRTGARPPPRRLRFRVLRQRLRAGFRGRAGAPGGAVGAFRVAPLGCCLAHRGFGHLRYRPQDGGVVCGTGRVGAVHRAGDADTFPGDVGAGGRRTDGERTGDGRVARRGRVSLLSARR